MAGMCKNIEQKIIQLLVWIIYAYRFLLGSFFSARCRFHPSCSEYAILSLQKKGLVLGLYGMCKRIVKCQPFHKGGFDPV